MKTSTGLLAFLSLLLWVGCSEKNTPLVMSGRAISIPLAENVYVTQGFEEARINTRGIERWTGENAALSVFFKQSEPGELLLFLKASAENGSGVIRVSCLGQDFTVRIDQPEETVYPVGKVTIKQPGYIPVELKGLSKTGEQYPFVTSLLVDGSAAAEPLWYVHDFETYWGLRGPSVHLKYSMPEEEVEYFYNEITVPVGEDVIGSYYMANGFGEGYCGIQINSETERRILFSVWSPFVTDNPDEIPEDDRIRLLDKGKDVHIGEFGNEGSGGQSYWVYPWKAGETYRFLTRVKPDEKGNTDYYAWFMEPGKEEWHLVAGFKRPKTNTWYIGAHSFLENFIPGQGYITRKVNFGNQWVRTVKGEWVELTEAMFTYDATAAAQQRMDYAGGLDGDHFFLKNSGFFNDNTEYKRLFTRPAKGVPPGIIPME
ncbi:MAG: DUF3472 domain-containing protein [Tannerellaceae bacterium]|nr:DUF3472 domain-containing protein [Tannerellaceae bacterium]